MLLCTKVNLQCFNSPVQERAEGESKFDMAFLEVWEIQVVTVQWPCPPSELSPIVLKWVNSECSVEWGLFDKVLWSNTQTDTTPSPPHITSPTHPHNSNNEKEKKKTVTIRDVCHGHVRCSCRVACHCVRPAKLRANSLSPDVAWAQSWDPTGLMSSISEMMKRWFCPCNYSV